MWALCPSFSPWLPLLFAPSPSFARTCGYAAALRFACERRSYQKERATAKSRLVGSPRKNVYHRKNVLSHRNCVTVIQRLLFQSGADPPCCSGSEAASRPARLKRITVRSYSFSSSAGAGHTHMRTPPRKALHFARRTVFHSSARRESTTRSHFAQSQQTKAISRTRGYNSTPKDTEPAYPRIHETKCGLPRHLSVNVKRKPPHRTSSFYLWQ